MSEWIWCEETAEISPEAWKVIAKRLRVEEKMLYAIKTKADLEPQYWRELVPLEDPDA